MNKTQRKKMYFEFLKKQTELARSKVSIPYHQEDQGKYSEKAKEISRLIKDADFGCQTDTVYELMKVVTGEDIPSPIEEDGGHNLTEEHLKELCSVPWACYSHKDQEDYIVSLIHWNESHGHATEVFCEEHGIDNGITHSSSWENVSSVDFATDAQIKMLVDKAFSSIDHVLIGLTH